MIELKKIDGDNVWKILKLKVLPEQDDFVASNTESIVEAYTTITSGGIAMPFGIYSDDVPVGFVMLGYGTTGDEDEPDIADGNYCIWRFMIDKDQQGKGYGKAAFSAIMDYIKTFPCGEAEYVWLSFEPENVRAEKLYTSFGFIANGETCGEEIVYVRKI